MITITKKFNFCYGHHLPEYVGKCRDQHGHNSILEVEICGPAIGAQSPKGMVFDFSQLKDIVEARIIEVLDHKNINDLEIDTPLDVPWLKVKEAMIEMPTAENIINWIHSVLFTYFRENLVRIRLYETPTSYAEYK